MSYSMQVGKVSPLVLRDALLDFVLGRETPENRPMWEWYGNPRQIFLPVGHPKLLTQIYGGSPQAKKFFYQLLLAMETLVQTCNEFYPGRGWEQFLALRREMQTETRCMLYFKLIAWLSLDGRREVELLLPQLQGMNLHYGLVTQYPEPILHTARCFATYDREEYELVLPASRLRELNERAESLIAAQAMSINEPNPLFQDEENEPVPEPREVTGNIEPQELADQLELLRLRSQLIEAVEGILRLSCPLRQHTKGLTDHLWGLLKDWIGG